MVFDHAEETILEVFMKRLVILMILVSTSACSTNRAMVQDYHWPNPSPPHWTAEQLAEFKAEGDRIELTHQIQTEINQAYLQIGGY